MNPPISTQKLYVFRLHGPCKCSIDRRLNKRASPSSSLGLTVFLILILCDFFS
jgi:hypothetical protein